MYTKRKCPKLFRTFENFARVCMKYEYKNGITLRQMFLEAFVSLQLLAKIFWVVGSRI